MADLYSVSDGDVALAADVNQYRTALEGGAAQQFSLVQKAGANFTIQMATANGSDKVSFKDSAQVEVASLDSDGSFTSNAIVLPSATSPAQTASGSVVWDSNDEVLTVGDGTSRVVFTPSRIARSTSNFTKNTNDTLADVTGIVTAIGASEVRHVVCDLQCSANASGGLKVAFTVPSGAAVTGTVEFITASGLAATRSSDLTSASGSTAAVVAIRISATVVNSTTAGNVQLQAAQNASHASDSIIYAQSTMTSTRIA